jgi:hypothetical protein
MNLVLAGHGSIVTGGSRGIGRKSAISNVAPRGRMINSGRMETQKSKTQMKKAREIALGATFTIGVLTALASAEPENESGLMLHYDFSKESLTTSGLVRDVSGNGNDGMFVGVTLVTRGDGFAARFDRPMSYVECAKPGFQSTDAMTISFWLYMEQLPLVWDPFVAREGVYTLSMDRKGWMTLHLTGHRGGEETGVLKPMGIWRHIALVFDATGEETDFRCYVNGQFLPRRRMDATGAAVDTRIALRRLASGGALHLGWKKSITDARDLPAIEMSDFRIYNRALSAGNVADLFREPAVAQVEVKPYVYRFSDEVILGLHTDALAPLPDGAEAEILIRRKGENNALIRETAPLAADSLITEVLVSMQGMSAGDYEIDVNVFGANREHIGRKSVTPLLWPEKPSWPGTENATVLNALVTELIDVRPARDIQETYRFVNPRDGWIFFSAATETPDDGSLQITLDPAPDGRVSPIVIQHDGSASTEEAMRLLPKGEYRLRMDPDGSFNLSSLIVRAIPLLGDGFPMVPHTMQEYGAYDWNFMSKHLTSLNLAYHTATGHGRTDYGGGGEGFRDWQKQGKLAWGGGHMPKSADEEGVAAILEILQSPDWDGIRIDEEGYPGHHPKLAPALRYLAENYNELFAAGKSVNVYTYGQAHMFQSTRERGARELLEAILPCNGHYISEIYLSSSKDEATARASLDTAVTSWIAAAKRSYPNAQTLVSALFGTWMHPTGLNSDMHADVDYKAFMEMQVRSVALSDVCFGMRGLGIFQAAHIDEETARWWGKLLRHYGIEGRTDKLWKGPYKMSHVRNPHFERGLDHWSAVPAESGGVFMSSAEQCGMLIRHWSEASNEKRLPGADVVVMRQSELGPNTISQDVRHLEPGKLYSLRFTTADHGDMVVARQEGRRPTETPGRKSLISARLGGVKEIPEKSFSPGTFHKPDRRDEEGELHWKIVETGINFHRIVFRAESDSALLTFSDMPADGEEIRETLLTWVSVRPYLEN